MHSTAVCQRAGLDYLDFEKSLLKTQRQRFFQGFVMCLAPGAVDGETRTELQKPIDMSAKLAKIITKAQKA